MKHITKRDIQTANTPAEIIKLINHAEQITENTRKFAYYKVWKLNNDIENLKEK